MQQVPNPECASESSAVGSNHEVASARWSRIPRVQLVRNKNDQRVPLYFDQTVPVWPLRESARGNQSTNASPSSLQAAGGGRQAGAGAAKAARKFEAGNQTVWLRGLNGVLKASGAEAYACNVSEILRGCGGECSASAPGYPYARNSSKWSGIEQDLFTCTSVDPKVFVLPSTAEFISNKKSKNKSKSKE